MRALAVMLLLAMPAAAHAASQAEAEAALDSAVQAEATAAQLGNRWLPAEAALKAARTALAAQSWDKSASEAAKAHALALRAIEQSHEQETAWRDAVIR